MGLSVTLITFSPNTTIKSADMNTNLTNLNNASSFSGSSVTTTALNATGMATLSGGISFSVVAGQTERGHYRLAGGTYVSGAIVSEQVITLSRNLVPVSVVIDTTDQSPTFINSPTVANFSTGGFLVYSSGTGVNVNAFCAGNYTANY